MNRIIRIISSEYVKKLLSEQKICLDQIDLRSVQTLSDFTEFSKPMIQYEPGDFLISITASKFEILKKNHWIDLSEVEQFGWYYEKIHKSEMQLFKSTAPNKYRNLLESNPIIRIESFDKYRSCYRPLKLTNVLIGGLGLCYFAFKEDYDNLFRKIEVYKDQWIIRKHDLEKTDYPMLSQIFLFYNSQTKKLEKNLLKDDSLEGIKIFNFFLEQAMSYFIQNDYSMDGLLTFLYKSFTGREDMEIFANEFKELNDRFVKRGLDYNSHNPITNATKTFISLAKSESQNLNKLLATNESSKTALFLLGMLNLGDKIDEQLSFDNFIPAIVDLTVRYIVNVEISQKEIRIYFDKNIIDKNRNNKFSYVRDYFSELNKIQELCSEINTLKAKDENLSRIYNYTISADQLNKDIECLERKKEELQNEKNALQDGIKTLKSFKDSYKLCLDSENEIEKLGNRNSELIRIISGLKKDEKKLKTKLVIQEKKNALLEEESPSLEFNEDDEIEGKFMKTSDSKTPVDKKKANEGVKKTKESSELRKNNNGIVNVK